MDMKEYHFEISKDLKFDELYENLMKINYICVLLVFLVEVGTFIGYLHTDMIQSISVQKYAFLYLIRPSFINILALFAGSLIHRHHNEKVTHIAPIITLMIIMFCVTTVHYTYATTYCSMIIPLCLSIVYSSKRTEMKLYLLANFFYTLALLLTKMDTYSSYPKKLPYNIAIGYVSMLLVHFLVRAVIDFEQKKLLLMQDYYDKSKQMEQRANHDGLTGLYNVRSLKETATKWLEEGKDVSYTMFDIDNFKAVNDTWGHDFGDIVLKRFASILKTHENEDVFVARYGGEEFGVLTCNLAVDQVVEIVNNICTTFRIQVYRETAGPFTVSGGLAFGKEGETCEELFKSADVKLYQAKNAGKNHVCS